MTGRMRPETPEELLGFAAFDKHKGAWLVGYAWVMRRTRNTPDEWPLVQQAIDRGWLVWHADASPERWHPHYGDKRTIYRLTAAGERVRAALPSA